MHIYTHMQSMNSRQVITFIFIRKGMTTPIIPPAMG